MSDAAFCKEHGVELTLCNDCREADARRMRASRPRGVLDMSSPTQPVPPAPLSDERLASLLDDTRRLASKVVDGAAAFLYDMALERAINVIADRDKRLAAVKKVNDENFKRIDGRLWVRCIEVAAALEFGAAEGRTP
jgi:hypothetical protein